MSPSKPPTIDRIQALANQGQFEAALPLCEQLTQLEPQNDRAWFWLGQVQLLRGNPAAAQAALQQAIALAPYDALHWTNLSVVAVSLGQPDEAESHARRAVALDASSTAVWVNLGTALYHQRRWSEAADAYRQATTIEPGSVAAWSNLASAELRGDRLDEAQFALERALAIAPAPEPAVMYGSLLLRRGQPRQAIHILRQVVAQVPDMAEAWLNLGDALGLDGNPPEAEAACRRALALNPHSRQARQSLALHILAQFRLSEAESLMRELVESDPNDAESWAFLASIEQAQAKITAALNSSRRALAIDPDPTRHSRMLTVLQYLDDIQAPALLAEHLAWNDAYARQLAPQSPVVYRQRAAGEPLRVGLVSANFGRHPIAFLALSALESLDKNRCSLVCYSDRCDADDFTDRFRAASEVWRETAGLSDEQLAHQIRQDEIDVLIDLMGHTGRRLIVFARKPAPVQVAWLGYVGTTGLEAMDFLLADRHHVRPGEEAWYSEAVLRLPNSYACYSPPHYMPEVNPLPAATVGKFTFGVLSNPAKFSPRMIAAWADILGRVPTAQLLLKFAALDEPHVQAPIRAEFEKRDIAPSRVIIEGNAPHHEFLAAYSRVDLALDTQPYSGGVTTCEALWMGVPVITFPGRTFAGRHATSYVTTAGLAQFVAKDLPGYIDCAVRWANRLDELATLRATLRDRLRNSPLADAPRFANDFLRELAQAIDSRGRATA
jgi:protein O-GlcNAc transferase